MISSSFSRCVLIHLYCLIYLSYLIAKDKLLRGKIQKKYTDLKAKLAGESLKKLQKLMNLGFLITCLIFCSLTNEVFFERSLEICNIKRTDSSTIVVIVINLVC